MSGSAARALTCALLLASCGGEIDGTTASEAADHGPDLSGEVPDAGRDDGATGEPDAGAQPASDVLLPPDVLPSLPWPVLEDADRLEGFAGRIVVGSNYSTISFADAPPGRQYQVLFEEGGCQYRVRYPPGFCEPSCGDSQYCDDRTSECVERPHPLSAGDVSVSAGGETTVASPKSAGAPYYYPGPMPAGAFVPGQDVTISASGGFNDAGTVPAFEMHLGAIAEIDWKPELAVEEGMPAELAWEPAGDGAEVEVGLETGWHGAPSPVVVYCRVPESAGLLSVPWSMVEAFPFWQGGLFPNVPWIWRVRRVVLDSPWGPLEVAIRSPRTLQVALPPQ